MRAALIDLDIVQNCVASLNKIIIELHDDARALELLGEFYNDDSSAIRSAADLLSETLNHLKRHHINPKAALLKFR